MPCSTPAISTENITDADKLQYAATEKVHIAKLIQREALDAIKVPIVEKDALDYLSISLGTELDVGRADALPSDVSKNVFRPCDWPLDVLEYETRSARGYWRDLDHKAQDPAILLQFARMRNVWYEQCLYSLRRLVPKLWDVYRTNQTLVPPPSLPPAALEPMQHHHEYY
ncbi:hypothetical protein ISF_09907 [Cordyceps fumosorosea ARSEF 2679]|uniref:Uncharacterized protein n=1 Tax=Cordyceps fumosorosea (strain ARSEF 2679) TaxID=1081104 RepID=A0A166Z9V5_CORFA|nr:hypothetical protein ISF_09907 [Cordyceps fumosorosea ARSEF 2679]OAA37700.1 hypothetical protein ISF_09907 [Cordyceps fumosorosea ARSEF 2679]